MDGEKQTWVGSSFQIGGAEKQKKRIFIQQIKIDND